MLKFFANYFPSLKFKERFEGGSNGLNYLSVESMMRQQSFYILLQIFIPRLLKLMGYG